MRIKGSRKEITKKKKNLRDKIQWALGHHSFELLGPTYMQSSFTKSVL